MKRSSVSLLSLALCLLMLFSCIGSVPALAEAGDVPDHTKILTNNQDGTYTLSLDVTGEAVTTTTISPVNVLVILDTSSSMSNYFYVPSPTGRRGLEGRQTYFDLYTRNGNNYTIINDDISVPEGTTVYRRNNNGSYSVYDGDRYADIRRAAPTEQALYNFLSDLYKFDPDNAGLINVDIEYFNGGSGTIQSWTTNKNNVLGKLSNDGTHYHGGAGNTEVTNGTNGYYASGTNWEKGLKQGKTALTNLAANRKEYPTFVLFFTDGEPTRDGDDPNNSSNWEDMERHYNAAKDDANDIQQTIAPTGGNLYGIYAYGKEDDWLASMMYYVYHGQQDPTGDDYGHYFKTDNYFYANDTNELESAFNSIFNQIVDTLGIGKVTIHDGTTSKVTTTSGNLSHLLKVVEGSFQYWLSWDVTPGADGSYYTFTLPDKVSGEDVSYTVTVKDKNINIARGGVFVATYPGSIEGDKLKVKWTEATNFYYAPPAATFVDPDVDWDLSSLGTLLDGVTYEVTFDCYPSQDTYDTIAHLLNGDIAYADLDSNVREYLKEKYTLLTNTEATLTYTDTRTDDESKTSPYNNLEPVGLKSYPIDITKKWIGQENDIPDSMKLTILMDDVKFTEVSLPKNGKWETTAYISVGIIKDGKALSDAEGHDFTFAELDDTQYRWELAAATLHPMLIDSNSEVTLLVKEDADHPVPAGATTYTINKATYYVDSSTAELTATNYRRSDLNLKKVVDGYAPDASFPFTLQVKNSKVKTGNKRIKTFTFNNKK